MEHGTPPPRGFAGLVASGATNYALRKRFKCSDDLVKRWRAEVEAQGAPRPKKQAQTHPPMPAPKPARVPVAMEPEPPPRPTPDAPAQAVQREAEAKYTAVVSTLEAVATDDNTPAAARVAAARAIAELIGPAQPEEGPPVTIPTSRLEFAETMFKLIYARMKRTTGDAPFAALARRLESAWADLCAEREMVPGDPFAGKTEAEIRDLLVDYAENMPLHHLAVYAQVYHARVGA